MIVTLWYTLPVPISPFVVCLSVVCLRYQTPSIPPDNQHLLTVMPTLGWTTMQQSSNIPFYKANCGYLAKTNGENCFKKTF